MQATGRARRRKATAHAAAASGAERSGWWGITQIAAVWGLRALCGRRGQCRRALKWLLAGAALPAPGGWLKETGCTMQETDRRLNEQGTDGRETG